MPDTSPPIFAPKVLGTLLNAVTAASNSSTNQPVGAFNIFRFEITGTWKGIGWLNARQGTTVIQIPIFGAGGSPHISFTQNGIYEGAISGYDYVSVHVEPQFDYATWAALSAITGSNGQIRTVNVSDGGTHTDPVAGGTVNNAGYYKWSVSPAGWQRTGDNSVTVIGTLAQQVVNTPRRRIVAVGQPVLAFPVAAGATVKPITGLDVSYFTQIQLQARGASGTGQFQILYQPQALAGWSTYGSGESTLTVLDTTLRGFVPPFTPHDILADFSIVNSSGVDIAGIDLRVLGLT